MTRTTRSLCTPLLFLFLTIWANAQTINALPRSTPEAEGVSSEGILQFLDAAEKSNHEFHSIMILSLSPNDKYMQQMPFQWKNDVCQLSVKIENETHQLNFGAGKWVFGETNKRGPSLVGRAKAHFVGLPPTQVAGSYRWKDQNTLELTLRYIESPHTETFTCRFEQNKLMVEVQSSFGQNQNGVQLIGYDDLVPQKD